jgi:hypothetical protein
VKDLQAAAQPPHTEGALQVSASALLFAAESRDGNDNDGTQNEE